MTEMRVEQRFTQTGQCPYATTAFTWKSIVCQSLKPDGSYAPLEERRLEIPSSWPESLIARLAPLFLSEGVPSALRPVEEEGVPQWLQRREADPQAIASLVEERRSTRELSFQKVCDRIAGAWTYHGWQLDYFDSEEDARNFYDEIRHIIVSGLATPDLVHFRHLGIHWAYGITAPAPTHYYVDADTNTLKRREERHQRPQLFGTYTVTLPAEPSLLERAELFTALVSLKESGAYTGLYVQPGKEDAITAAHSWTGLGNLPHTMSLLVDSTHPQHKALLQAPAYHEIEQVRYAMGKERLARHARMLRRQALISFATTDDMRSYSPALREQISLALDDGIPQSLITRFLRLTQEGIALEQALELLDEGMEENTASSTPSALIGLSNGDFKPQAAKKRKRRLERLPEEESHLPNTLAEHSALAGWMAGEISAWLPDNAVLQGRENQFPAGASGILLPENCAGVVGFVNLPRFINEAGELESKYLRHVLKLMVMALNISLDISQAPAKEMAKRSFLYRPLALLPVGLEEAASALADTPEQLPAQAAGLTAFLTGTALAVSAELAESIGAFPGFVPDQEGFLEGLQQCQPISAEALAHTVPSLGKAIVDSWEKAIALTQEHGLRNIAVTALSSVAERNAPLPVEQLSAAPTPAAALDFYACCASYVTSGSCVEATFGECAPLDFTGLLRRARQRGLTQITLRSKTVSLFAKKQESSKRSVSKKTTSSLESV